MRGLHQSGRTVSYDADPNLRLSYTLLCTDACTDAHLKSVIY